MKVGKSSQSIAQRIEKVKKKKIIEPILKVLHLSNRIFRGKKKKKRKRMREVVK